MNVGSSKTAPTKHLPHAMEVSEASSGARMGEGARARISGTMTPPSDDKQDSTDM